jgi:hypothetical protein
MAALPSIEISQGRLAGHSLRDTNGKHRGIDSMHFFYFYAVLLVINVCCSYGAVLAIVWVYTYLRLICACLAFVFGIYLAVLLLRARHRYFSDPTGLKSPG